MQNVVIDEQLSAKETDAIKSEVHKILDEVRRNQEKLDLSQKEIDRLKIKTRVVLDQLEKAA
jgi:hypothetical protein